MMGIKEKLKDIRLRASVESKFPSPPGMKPLTVFHDGERVKGALGTIGRGVKKGISKVGQEARYQYYAAKRRKLLREEKRLIMESKWKYECPKCGRKFPTKTKKKEHMRRHTLGKRLLKGLVAAAYR